MTTIVAFLQNQWWKDPERVRDMLVKSSEPEKLRRRFLVYGLQGCKSGKMLAKHIAPAIGAEAFKSIYWENVSREMGDRSSSKFPADIDFIQKTLVDQSPRIVLCFGKVASDAVGKFINEYYVVGEDLFVLYADHPAARNGPQSLIDMAHELKKLLDKENEV